MKLVTVSQMTANEEAEGYFLIKSLLIKTTNQNKKYLDLIFADKSGEIGAKKWECTPEEEEKYAMGDVVKVRGLVNEWQGKLQLKVFLMRPAEEADGVDFSALVPAAPYGGEEMYQEMVAIFEGFQDEDLKKLSLDALIERKSKLLYYPAAKSNHHAIRSGLLYHMKRMMQTAEALCKVYGHIRRELLLTGILFHDLEKINELNAGELGMVSSYSTEGVLLGHIVMGVKYIEEKAKALGISSEKKMLLEHMVLSHHYEPEFGSPVKPLIPEGELLHYIDVIDARMYDMEKALSGVLPGEFSEPVFSLDRRKLYQPVL